MSPIPHLKVASDDAGIDHVGDLMFRKFLGVFKRLVIYERWSPWVLCFREAEGNHLPKTYNRDSVKR